MVARRCSRRRRLVDRTIMEVFYWTGLRRWELARLELTDIDRQRRTILVRCGKGRKDRARIDRPEGSTSAPGRTRSPMRREERGNR